MTLLAFLSLTCGLVLDTVMCGRIETKRMHYWSVSLRFNPLRTVAWRMRACDRRIVVQLSGVAHRRFSSPPPARTSSMSSSV
jgi:hypothetical protein